jgi:hypothetical protein
MPPNQPFIATNAIPVQAVVCLPAKDSVTLCVSCGAPFVPQRRTARFCSEACRQAAHRKSSAHAEYLHKLRAARATRKKIFYHRKTRDKALGTFRGYGGPTVPGVPLRVTMLKLQNYYPENMKMTTAIQETEEGR